MPPVLDFLSFGFILKLDNLGIKFSDIPGQDLARSWNLGMFRAL